MSNRGPKKYQLEIQAQVFFANSGQRPGNYFNQCPYNNNNNNYNNKNKNNNNNNSIINISEVTIVIAFFMILFVL